MSAPAPSKRSRNDNAITPEGSDPSWSEIVAGSILHAPGMEKPSVTQIMSSVAPRTVTESYDGNVIAEVIPHSSQGAIAVIDQPNAIPDGYRVLAVVVPESTPTETIVEAISEAQQDDTDENIGTPFDPPMTSDFEAHKSKSGLIIINALNYRNNPFGLQNRPPVLAEDPDV